MKIQFTFILILFVLFAHTAQGQENVPSSAIKPIIQFGFITPFPQVSSPTMKFKPKTSGDLSLGLKAGFSILIPLAPRLAISPGVYYNIVNLSYGPPGEAANDYTITFPSTKLKHLQVPLDLKVELFPWLKIAPGLQAAYLISAVTNGQDSHYPDIKNYKAFKPWDFGTSFSMYFIVYHAEDSEIGVYSRYLRDLSNQARRPELIPGNPNLIKIHEFELGVSLAY